MSLGDVFKSLFGFHNDAHTRPRYGPPPENSQPEGLNEDQHFADHFLRRSFFFDNVPPDPFFGGFRGPYSPPGEDNLKEGEPSPFGFFGFTLPGVGGEDDLFRHFDDMFRSFEEIFRSVGVADFSAIGPGNDRPALGDDPERLTPRDSMLKNPDSHRDLNDDGSQKSEQHSTITTPQPAPSPPPSNQPSNVPGNSPFSFFGDTWSMPQWTRPNQPAMPQDPLDSDLDEEVKRGGLLRILEPYKKSPSFPGVRIMEPPVKQKPEGYRKAVHVYTYKSAGDKSEQRRTAEDGEGNKITTVTRSIGDRVYSITTKKTPSGEEVSQNYANMDESNKREFEENWKERPPIGQNPTIGGHGLIFDLFRKGFPGFPSPKS